MTYIIIIFVSVSVLLLGYIFILHKEIKHITEQLQAFLNGQTGQKVSVELFSEELNQLVITINELEENNIKANIKMQNAAQEMQQAIANMSHDLRTPLTAILGYIQLLKDNMLSKEETDDYLNILHDRAVRLHTLINDFFELSIIDSHEHVLEGKPLNLTWIVKETLLAHYEILSRAGIKPIIEGIDEVHTIIADENAVHRVIENLLSNSLKYSMGNMTVNLTEQEGFVELCVSNNTNSLFQQDVPLIFDRFYIADKVRSGQGNGLGLPIVKSLMEKMGGTVTAQMNENTFFIVCRWRSFRND